MSLCVKIWQKFRVYIGFCWMSSCIEGGWKWISSGWFSLMAHHCDTVLFTPHFCQQSALMPCNDEWSFCLQHWDHHQDYQDGLDSFDRCQSLSESFEKLLTEFWKWVCKPQSALMIHHHVSCMYSQLSEISSLSQGTLRVSCFVANLNVYFVLAELKKIFQKLLLLISRFIQ